MDFIRIFCYKRRVKFSFGPDLVRVDLSFGLRENRARVAKTGYQSRKTHRCTPVGSNPVAFLSQISPLHLSKFTCQSRYRFFAMNREFAWNAFEIQCVN
jgi:hypothetical protein